MYRRILGLVFAIGVSLTATWAQLPEAPNKAKVDKAKASAGEAWIVVRVPADAAVFFGKQRMSQGGTERKFVTQGLNAGAYEYQVSAQWKKNGKDQTINRSAIVSPGTTVTVDFTTDTGPVVPNTEAKQVQPRTPQSKSGEEKGLAAKPGETRKAENRPVDAKAIAQATPAAIARTKKDEASSATVKPRAGNSRSFMFHYSGKVSDLPRGKVAKVWVPVPQSTHEQQVLITETRVPDGYSIGRDKTYGNNILHFQTPADDRGEIAFDLKVKVTRHEVKTNTSANLIVDPAEDKSLLNRFLQADQKVPIAGKPLELIKDRKLPPDQFVAAKVLYDVVNGHMKYSKEGKGWGQGDAVWACDSKFGNCTDFHSLFISMARGNKIPSKFEMGFSIPPTRGTGAIGGYHCWAWFKPNGKGWVPVDISEANRFPDKKEYYFGNLTEDRVQFTTGRDITLEPPQSGPALNFFIYPYVEVDGQPYSAEKITRSFSYKDVD